ncbi:DUF1028 domain-containing protein [Egicoccus halophilus]|uniref:Major pilin protein fimA n=1 Tax=Egicoccus halophilus TaxID=1670830 RepID=A0A8J3AGS6_9ACTN|nr:DUF1028 domain-containing protein [Egicoccus halophilus]GGI08076.1 hypothetical protein GCM10011354_27290 [Egicoccus halophilus]
MTFSLVVTDPTTGHVGVAAMTAMPGVGKLVAHARARSGAAASQAMMNPYLAFDGLALVGQGIPADQALDYLVAQDPGREGRQFGLVDFQGRSASHTGSLPEDFKGHRTGPHYACQGNRLAGPEVLDAAVEAYSAHDGEELIDRLLAALAAGEEQGGDTKGHRSATVVIMGTELYPLWDLRIDDTDDPLTLLRQQKETFAEELIPEVEMLPTRIDPLGGFDYQGSAGAV